MYRKGILTFVLILIILSIQACYRNQNRNDNVSLKPNEELKSPSPTDSTTSTYTNENVNTSEQDSNKSSIIDNGHHEVTLEQIKSTYKLDEILDIKYYGDNYVLIKSHRIRERGITYDPNDIYTFYNLKTGDADILGTAPFIVELQEIESPNHIVFYCNGQNIMAPFHNFPFILSCERKGENVDSDSDFTETILPKYFTLGKNITFGDAANAIVSDINISDQNIEVTFARSNNEIDSSLLIDGRIPVTKVNYIPDKSKITFEINKSFIAEKYKNSGNKINQGNDYMDSIELNEDSGNANIIINLKSSTKQYSCHITVNGTLKMYFSNESPTNEGNEASSQTDLQLNNITFDDQKQVEQLIKLYFYALEKGDYSTAWGLMSSEQQGFNPLTEAIKNHWGVETIKLISMQGYLPPYLSETGQVPPNTPVIWFDVKLDIKPSDGSGWDDGINERFVMVTKNTEGKWRISGLSTSP